MTAAASKATTAQWRHRLRSSLTAVRRRCRLLAAAPALLTLGFAAPVMAEDAPVPQDSAQTRAGYSAGYAFGGQLAELQRQQPAVDLEAVFRGMLDALSGAEPRLSEDEMRAALQQLSSERSASAPARARPPERTPGSRSGGYVDDFAALNAKREGVITLPSGVQYEVLEAGNGRQPGAGNALLVSYQGSLTNGAVFDSTYEDGEPARLQLDEIAVPGLKEALLLMDEGAKWRVVIPPSMGFRTSGNNMLRRRDLIYDIELVAIEMPATPAATPDTPGSPSADNVMPAPGTPASSTVEQP